ncbi:MAG: ABC transporter substrate-binding protein [Candidatus Methanospirareceae archaeon]
MEIKSKATVLFLLIAISVSVSSIAAAKQGEPLTIRIGFQPSAHHAAGAIAFEKGWFEEAGINATVAGIFWGGGSPEMEAMRAGEMDVAYVGVSPMINAIGHGMDAKVVAQAQKEAMVLVVAATNGTPDWIYKEPKDLEGKIIGTLTAGSIQDVVLNYWLEQQHKAGKLDKNKVTIKYMGFADMMTGLRTKKLDAIWFSEEWTSIPVIEGFGAYANLTSKEAMPNHPCCVLLVSGELIREHPDLVRKLVEIHIRATEYAIEHPEETAEICYKFFEWEEHGFPYEAMRHGIMEGIIPIGWDHNPHNISDMTMELVNIHLERGYIDRALEEDDIFDYRFYDNITRGVPLVTTPTPKETPKETPKPSGFEAMVALFAILIVVFLRRGGK